MSLFPVTPLVRDVQELIVQTFVVSEQEAQDYAAEMVALASGWGGPEVAFNLDWPYRIRKDLGETNRLKWRSEEDRIQFETAEKKKYAAWNTFINSKYRG